MSRRNSIITTIVFSIIIKTTLQMRVLTDRQVESRASLGDTPLTPLTLGDTPLTIGSSSFEGMPAPVNQLTNGAVLDTEEELAEAGSYIRSLSKFDSSKFELFSY